MKEKLVEISYRNRPKSIKSAMLFFFVACGLLLSNFALLSSLMMVPPISFSNYAISTAIFLIPGIMFACAIYKGKGAFVIPLSLTAIAIIVLVLFIALSAGSDSFFLASINIFTAILLVGSIVPLFMSNTSKWFYQVRMAHKGVDKISDTSQDSQLREWKINTALSRRPKLMKYALYLAIFSIPVRVLTSLGLPAFQKVILSHYTGTTESLIFSYLLAIVVMLGLEQWFIRSMYKGFGGITWWYKLSLSSGVLNVILLGINIKPWAILPIILFLGSSVTLLVILMQKQITEWFSACKLARS